MVGASSVGEEWKKAAREETDGLQEMEELPWGPEAVRPYQVYSVTPGLGGSAGDNPSRQQGYILTARRITSGELLK